MQRWGEKSWRHACIISYICPHFLQKMIDLANYPILPSLLHTTSGHHYGGNQRSLGMSRIADTIWLFMSWESKQWRKTQILSWLYVNVICSGDGFNDACSVFPLCRKWVWRRRGELFFSSGTVSGSQWKQKSGPENCLNPKPSVQVVLHGKQFMSAFDLCQKLYWCQLALTANNKRALMEKASL